MTATDLPTLGQIAPATGSAVFVEAFGDPQTQEQPTVVALTSMDMASSEWSHGLLRGWTDHRPVTSAERWLRVDFEQPFGEIQDLRFWVDGLVPNEDWVINWGTTDTYTKPTAEYSSVAFSTIPTANPGKQNVTVYNGVASSAFSDWIVLQVVWTGSTPGPMQTSPLTIRLAWSVV